MCLGKKAFCLPSKKHFTHGSWPGGWSWPRRSGTPQPPTHPCRRVSVAQAALLLPQPALLPRLGVEVAAGRASLGGAVRFRPFLSGENSHQHGPVTRAAWMLGTAKAVPE